MYKLQLTWHYMFIHRNRDSHPPEIDKMSVQPAANLYVTMSDDTPEQPDDNYAYCRTNTVTAVPPAGCVVVEANTPPNNTPQTASVDDLYSKPNKLKKPDKKPQDASDYACVYGHVNGDIVDNGTTGSGNGELDYIEIDHKGTEGAMRDVGPQPQSETVIYAEVKPKTTTADSTPQVGDTDVSMVENDLYT